MTPDRDRDRRGRPKNARPRDALGRPLARDGDNVLPEEDLPEDPLALLAIGVDHFNAARFFQAHEAWETAWHPSPQRERDFWQGITQVAVGFTHRQRGNERGAITLLRRGADKLDAFAEGLYGFPVRQVRDAARAAADAIERDGLRAEVAPPTITLR